jgi:hypothetical protein
MTRHEIATLACKLLALWIIIQGVLYLPYLLYWLFLGIATAHNEFAAGFQLSAVYSFLSIGSFLIGLALWLLAPRLAARMVKSDDTAIVFPDLTQSSAMVVAFTAIGVFTLVPALKDLANLTMLYMENNSTQPQLWNNADTGTQLASFIIELLLSLWLIFGSRGIVRLVLWARTAATKHQTPAPPSSPDQTQS